MARWVGPPKAYTPGRVPGRPPTVIIIHTTEGGKGPGKAAAGAAYDKRRTDGTSCHQFVDSIEACQEVHFADRAHAARAHGNVIGVQFELCNNASQTGVLDDIWMSTLRIAAKEVAAACTELNIPVVKLSPNEVRQSYYNAPAQRPRGICGHADVTKAFPEDQGTHTDPGVNFPWTLFLGMVKEAMGGTPILPEGGDMAQVFQWQGNIWISRGDATYREKVCPMPAGTSTSPEANVVTDPHKVYPGEDARGYPVPDLKDRGWNEDLVTLAFGPIGSAVSVPPGSFIPHTHTAKPITTDSGTPTE